MEPTEEGGTANEGTIFEVTAAGKETVLYSFPNQTDGVYTFVAVTQGPKGLVRGRNKLRGGGCRRPDLRHHYRGRVQESLSLPARLLELRTA